MLQILGTSATTKNIQQLCRNYLANVLRKYKPKITCNMIQIKRADTNCRFKYGALICTCTYLVASGYKCEKILQCNNNCLDHERSAIGWCANNAQFPTSTNDITVQAKRGLCEIWEYIRLCVFLRPTSSSLTATPQC